MTTPGTKGRSKLKGVSRETGVTKTGRQAVEDLTIYIGPAFETLAGEYQGLKCTKKPLYC